MFFFYQLSKLHQSEAKTLKLYKPCERFDIRDFKICYGEALHSDRDRARLAGARCLIRQTQMIQICELS